MRVSEFVRVPSPRTVGHCRRLTVCHYIIVYALTERYYHVQRWFLQCWRRWDGAPARLPVLRPGDAGVFAVPGAHAAGAGRRVAGADRRRGVQLHGVQQHRVEPVPAAPLPRRASARVTHATRAVPSVTAPKRAMIDTRRSIIIDH